jgi:hypothetical protein
MRTALRNPGVGISTSLVGRALLQRKCDCGGSPGTETECEDCRKQKLAAGPKLHGSQRLPEPAARSARSSVSANTAKAGPLDPSSLGHSFGSIRVEPAEDDAELSQLDLDETTDDRKGEGPADLDDPATQSDPGSGDPKRKPAKRRRRVLHGDFSGGGLISRLGGTRGIYLRHRHLDLFGMRRPKQEYEIREIVVGKKIVIVSAKSEGDGSASFDNNNIIWVGNALFADSPVVTPPPGGKYLDQKTVSSVTATLKYSVGDESDTPAVGGKGRIVVSRLAPGGDKLVYDSGMTTTLGKPVTIDPAQLKNLEGNSVYKIEITRETWWAGKTEFMFDLELHQQVETKARYEVTCKKKVRVPITTKQKKGH